MHNMETQTDGWDDIPFCDDPECETHSEDVMDFNTKRRLKKIAIGVGIVGGGAVAGVGAVLAAPVIIGAAGFGAAGVVAGSAAAAVQSWIGSVAAGSLFASLQSAGVLGLAATTNAAVGVTVAAGTSGGALLATRKNVKVKHQKTQTHGHCPNILKKILYYEAETKRMRLRERLRVKKNLNDPRYPLKSDLLLPTPEETVSEQMNQTHIQDCLQENIEHSDRTTATCIKAMDQGTQTQIDEPKSSFWYEPSESEADLTSDEEDAYLGEQIDAVGAANKEITSKITQTHRRPIRMDQEASSSFVRYW